MFCFVLFFFAYSSNWCCRKIVWKSDCTDGLIDVMKAVNFNISSEFCDTKIVTKTANDTLSRASEDNYEFTFADESVIMFER